MPQTTDPSVTEDPNILSTLRDFIASMWNLDAVGGRDAESRFDWDPGHVTSELWGDNEVFRDDRTGNYWFDQNGNGTVETQFGIDNQGRIWYDLNNDGSLDTIVDPAGFP